MLLALILVGTVSLAYADDCDLDKDYWGGDLYTTQEADFQACKDTCYADPACEVCVFKEDGWFVFDAYTCYIKDITGTPMPCGNCRTALRSCLYSEYDTDVTPETSTELCDIDNTDMWFGDIYQFVATDFEACKDKCYEEAECNAVVYYKSGSEEGKCWIKNSDHWALGSCDYCRAAMRSCINTEHIVAHADAGTHYSCASSYPFPYDNGNYCCKYNLDGDAQELAYDATTCFNGGEWTCPEPPCTSYLESDDGNDAYYDDDDDKLMAQQ